MCVCIYMYIYILFLYITFYCNCNKTYFKNVIMLLLLLCYYVTLDSFVPTNLNTLLGINNILIYLNI